MGLGLLDDITVWQVCAKSNLSVSIDWSLSNESVLTGVLKSKYSLSLAERSHVAKTEHKVKTIPFY